MTSSSASSSSTLLRLRASAGAFVVDNAFRGLSAIGRAFPQARPERHDVEVLRDVPYRATGLAAHRLDVYRPAGRRDGPSPALLYIHGGGFRILSKDTHWLMGLAFARRGYVVFNVNYRLAPAHPYPAAAEDVCAAYRWVVDNAARYGGDTARLVIAGESAGANLTAMLAVATAYRRPEPWAREVFDTGVRPVAAVPACGMLQVSDSARFVRRRMAPVVVDGRVVRRRPLNPFIADRLHEVTEAYLGGARTDVPGGLELADPLVILERGERPDRPLPPFFAPVGTRDPLLDDTRRLKVALEQLDVPCVVEYYPGEVHAFHAFVFRPNATRCWRDTFRFLDTHVPREPAGR